MAIFYRRTWSVEADPNWIDTTAGIPTADPRWRGTDSNGHEHHYDHGYPTLDYVIDAEHWCMGDEGIAPHDPHMAVDESLGRR